MTGNNAFLFNEATMMKMVQFYLDNKMLNKDENSPRVTSVKYDTASNIFEVKIDSEQMKAA